MPGLRYEESNELNVCQRVDRRFFLQQRIRIWNALARL
jgi:hypothetical protein